MMPTLLESASDVVAPLSASGWVTGSPAVSPPCESPRRAALLFPGSSPCLTIRLTAAATVRAKRSQWARGLRDRLSESAAWTWEGAGPGRGAMRTRALAHGGSPRGRRVGVRHHFVSRAATRPGSLCGAGPRVFLHRRPQVTEGPALARPPRAMSRRGAVR